MRTLEMNEIDMVGGGALSVGEAAGLTLACMSLAVTSPVVIGVGCAALLYYALC
jgi:hypothetical protein